MADRSVSVRLSVESGQFVAGVARATGSLKTLRSELAMASRTNEAEFRKIGMAAGVAAVGLVLAGGKAASAWMGFSKQMSGVASVANASADDLARLSDAALKAGASTELAGVTASDAARAEMELAKAGVTVDNILGGGLTGALSLASAAQIDFGAAAEISAQAMKIFALNGRDVGHIADVLAAGANKSAADVASLGDALRQGGLVASQLGIGLEDTVGTLALFADNALQGSDAGTSLKTLLQRLAPQSAEAAAEMERLGFSAFDASGKFVGMGKLAEELQTSFGELTDQQRLQAMGTVFGADAIRAANVLFTAGASTVGEYTAAVDDNGAAARMAAMQMDNLAGDVEALGGAFESALISAGKQSDGVLRALAQSAGDVVSGFAALPTSAQQATVGIGAATTAGLGLVAVAGTMLPRVREVTDSLGRMGPAGKFLGRNLGTIAKGAGLATIGLGLLTKAAGDAAQQADELVQSLMLDVDSSNLTEVNAALASVRSNLGQLDAEWGSGGVFDNLTNSVVGAVEVLTPLENSIVDNVAGTHALRDAEEALTRIQQNLSGNTAELMNTLGLTAEEVKTLAKAAGVDLAGAYGDVVPSLQATYREVSSGTPLTNDLAEATEILASNVTTAGDKLDAYRSSLATLFTMQFGVEESTENLAVNLADLAAGIATAAAEGDRWAASLDAGTVAGLNNREQVRGLVQGALDVAGAMYEADESATTIALTMAGFRDELIDALVATGMERAEVEYLTAALGELPTNTGITITAHTEQAIAALDRFIGRLRAIPNSIQSTVSAAEERDAIRFRNQLSLGPAPALTGVTAPAGPAARAAGAAARESAAGSAADAAKKAEDERRQQLAEQDAHNRRMFEHGMQSVEQYKTYLDARLAQEKTHSAEWFALKDEQIRVNEEIGKAWLEAAEAQREAEDNQYTAGRVTTGRYREMLRERADAAIAAYGYWSDEAQEAVDKIVELDESFVSRLQAQQDRQFDEGRLSVAEYKAILMARHAAMVEAHGYWAEEAGSIRDILRGIDEDIADAADKAAKEASDAAEQLWKLQGDRLGRLNDLLDDERAIRKRIEQSADQHRLRMAEIAKRFVDDQQATLDQRREQLLGWADVSQRVTVGWGNTASALTSNIQSQIEQFAEWADQLAAARASGVSEAVISLLGLDEGPQALGQLRMFSSATQGEIDALNSAVEARTAQAGDRVALEATTSYSRVGQMLYELAEKHAAEVEKLTEQFLADQRTLTEELAAIGQDQGLSYGDALAQGLRSAIPAIREAARAAREAMDQATAASAVPPSASGGARRGYVAHDSPPPPGGKFQWTNSRGDYYTFHGGTASVPGRAGFEVPAMLQAGERVFSVPDNRALIAAVQHMGSPNVSVNVAVYDANGRLVTDDRMRVVVTSTIRDMNTRSQIAGGH